jgi:exopolysaccharide biosynthesis polyprenyl glycosylphosphotransferase
LATEPILHPGAGIKRCEAVRAAAPGRVAQIAGLLGRSWVKRLFFLASDALAVMAAHHLADILTRRWMNNPATFLTPSSYYLFYVPFFAALLYLFGGYKSPGLRRPEKELELLTKGASFSFTALACANFVLFKSVVFSRYALVGWYILALVFLFAGRFSLRAMYAALWRRGFARQKALLIGPAARLADFQRRLSIQRYQGYELAGILLEPVGRTVSGTVPFALPVLGPLADWEEIVEAQGAQLIVVHLEEHAADRYPGVLEILRGCQKKGIEVEVYSPFYDAAELRCERDEFSGYLRFSSPPQWSRAAQRALKALLDILVGLAGSAVTLALLPIIGLFIKWEDGGAILHRSDYIGTDGCVHHFLKFRTMVENAEQILENDPALKAQFESSFKLKDDPRVLRVGRFLRKYSLDEFPQFFSVLAGHLTFVGPRAITSEQCERYGDLLLKLLSMKPGLTGFWQVMGRQTTTYEEKIQMDIFYIDHWSIWLDLIIIAKTFREVVRAQGAY